MQNKIKTLIAVLLLFVSATSCNDYLDLRPQDGIVREEFWKTKEDIQAAVAGIYSSLLNSPPGVNDLTLTQYLFMYGELRGDMVGAGGYVTEDERDIMNTNIIASNDLTSWAAFYKTINFCNTVIDLAPAVKNLDPTLTQTQLDHYLSEALAVRAYLYFTLARTFKDVPLKLTATMSDKDNFQIATSTQNDVFAQVIKDLKQAETYAESDYGNTASNKGRITIYSINAMLADVYLWTGNFQESLAASNKIINSQKFALVNASGNWFTTVFAKGNSSESIFEFQYTTSNLGPFYGIFYLRPQFQASPITLEKFYGIDYNNPNNKDIRGEFASIVPGTNEIWKFTAFDYNTRKAFQDSDTHWFVYRYSDILLMNAEALNELGQGADAINIIKDIRLKRGAIAITAENPDPANKNDVVNYILSERARELAFEGKRWFDLLRVARRNNYERLDIITNAAIASAPANQQQSIIAKLKDPNSHYLPINTYELYTNKALKQNPFYK